MDLGLKGKRAIICASSKGLGRACALALAEAGCAIVERLASAEQLAQGRRELAPYLDATPLGGDEFGEQCVESGLHARTVRRRPPV